MLPPMSVFTQPEKTTKVCQWKLQCNQQQGGTRRYKWMQQAHQVEELITRMHADARDALPLRKRQRHAGAINCPERVHIIDGDDGVEREGTCICMAMQRAAMFNADLLLR